MFHKVNLGIIPVIFGIILCTVSSSAYAADAKIAYLDIKSAIENTSQYKQAMHQIKALVEAKKKESKVLEDKAIQIGKDLQGQPMMSQEFRAQKQAELGRIKIDLERMGQDARLELEQKKQAMDRASMEKFKKVIAEYGKDHKYDMILFKQMIWYADPKYDLTAEITKLMDATK